MEEAKKKLIEYKVYDVVNTRTDEVIKKALRDEETADAVALGLNKSENTTRYVVQGYFKVHNFNFSRGDRYVN